MMSPDDVSPSGATPGRPEGESRLYELRLRIADARVRPQVATVLARRFPAQAVSVSSVVRALGEAGFVERVRLDEREAASLLRELYAAGAAPAGVVLHPTDVGAH